MKNPNKKTIIQEYLAHKINLNSINFQGCWNSHSRKEIQIHEAHLKVKKNLCVSRPQVFDAACIYQYLTIEGNHHHIQKEAVLGFFQHLLDTLIIYQLF